MLMAKEFLKLLMILHIEVQLDFLKTFDARAVFEERRKIPTLVFAQEYDADADFIKFHLPSSPDRTYNGSRVEVPKAQCDVIESLV